MSDESGRFDVPVSATALAGLTFKEAFQRFVLEDPTVTVAGDRAINEKLLNREALKSGEWPQLGHRWPLDLTADRLVREYCYIPLRIIDVHGRSAAPPAPASIRALAEVLAGRWQSFIGILSRGDLVAMDIDEKILGRGGWGRPNSAVDVQSGDLFDRDSSDEGPFRRGLMLSVPLPPKPLPEPSSIENDGIGRPAAAPQAASFDVPGLAPRLRLIHMAYEALGENLDAPLRPNLRLQKINEYLKGTGLIGTNDAISASRDGAEWVALNPTRLDGRKGSFKVNTSTGKWSDFATGEAGGDLVALAAYLFKLKQGEAAVKVAEMLGISAYE